MTAADLALNLADLDAQIARCNAALLAYNLDPSYSLEGDGLDREKYRESLLKQIRDAEETKEALIVGFNRQNPYVIATRQVLR